MRKKSLIPILALLYLVASSFFIWGVIVGNHKIFPWQQMVSVYEELHAFFTFQGGVEKSATDKVVLDHQEKRSQYDYAGFKLRDNDFVDDGFLLISRYSKSHKQVIVELFSISDQKVLYSWVPSVEEILQRTPNFSTGVNTKKTYRIQHPLLLKDGELIFTSGEGPMVRIDSCGNIKWILEHHFHHSIELDHSGNIITCSRLEGEGPNTVFPVRDNGVATVTLEGDIIDEFSVTELLLENGYKGLVYGVGKFEKDRLHLNDTHPILKEINEAKIGDILVSIRHLSTVAIVNPNSGIIRWLKTGPWLNQHDINQLADGRYSIFGNDMVRGYGGKGVKLVEEEKSEIYIYDPLTDTVTTPYSAVMETEKIWSSTQGRSKILENGDVYIEQTNTSRILRISKDRIRWEYVNGVSADTVGALHWSRYIPNDEINLNWLENLKCD